jgi:hypothetical protein
MRAGVAADTSARRGWWFDPRFAIGLALVVTSVLGVLWIVSSADSSVHVYAAREALSPGDRIRAGDLVDESVRIGRLDSRYLGREDLPTDGVVVTKAVGAGELVPASAVGSTTGIRMTSMVVPLSGQLARSIEPGAVVDLWSAQAAQGGAFGPPTVLVPSATVVRTIKADGVVVGGGGESVELLVPRTRTARVLEAVANDDAISLVPAGIPVGD